MKNVRKEQLKTCVFLEEAEFNGIIKKIFGNKAYVIYDDDGFVVQVNGDDDCINSETLNKELANYFDVAKVTSVHLDDCEYRGIWEVYRA